MKRQQETIETEKVRKITLTKLLERLGSVKWGSVEAYIQNGKITQITTRRIEKIENQ